MTMHRPLHPGKIVKEILIDGTPLSVTSAASHLGTSRTTLSRLLNGHMGISPDMAIRLSKLLKNTDVVLWMNLQRDYDIWLAEKRSRNIRIIPFHTDSSGSIA